MRWGVIEDLAANWVISCFRLLKTNPFTCATHASIVSGAKEIWKINRLDSTRGAGLSYCLPKPWYFHDGNN
jgi:hypothetical protein